jgi:hypothetical protein
MRSIPLTEYSMFVAAWMREGDAQKDVPGLCTIGPICQTTLFRGVRE